jgi:hypothetical protein
VLRSAALDEFYRVEEIELEAPKGEFKPPWPSAA